MHSIMEDLKVLDEINKKEQENEDELKAIVQHIVESSINKEHAIKQINKLKYRKNGGDWVDVPDKMKKHLLLLMEQFMEENNKKKQKEKRKEKQVREEERKAESDAIAEELTRLGAEEVKLCQK